MENMTEVQCMLPDGCIPTGPLLLPKHHDVWRRSAGGYREEDDCKVGKTSSEELADLKLALSVMELAGLRPDVDDDDDDQKLSGGSLRSTAASTVVELQVDISSPEDLEQCLTLIGLAMKLLRRCGYPVEDVLSIAAHASAYLDQVLLSLLRQKNSPRMKLMELAQVFCLLLYLAHVYVEDEHCQLVTWHKWLSRKYCDLSTLNSAVLSIMDTLNFSLRVEEADLSRRLKFLAARGDDTSSS